MKMAVFELRQWWLILISCLAIGLLPLAVAAECFEKSAFWKLEETAPPYLDSIDPQGAYNGYCIDAASCPSPVPGRFGAALKFHMNADKASGSGIVIAASAQADTFFDWAARDSFTIEFWMRRGPADIIRNEVIIGRNQSNTDLGQPDELHWWIGIGAPQGNARAYINARPLCLKSDTNQYVRGSQNKYLNSKRIICDNAWHHIVFVRDAAASVIRLYVDGTLEDQNTVIYKDVEGYKAFASNTANLNIGWLLLSQGYHYQGLLDEFTIYPMALPAWYIEHRYFSDERTDPCD